MRIGVYIGSFNPVHKGHIAMARHLLKKDYVDQLLMVPTGNYWYKQDLLPIEDRIRMLHYFEKDSLIIERELNSLPYTYELMRELKKRYINDQLFLVMGADSLVHFTQWKEYQELLNYDFLVFRRDDIDIDFYMKEMGKENYTIVNDLKLYNISSTCIRENIDDYERIKDMIDKRVWKVYRSILQKQNKTEIG